MSESTAAPRRSQREKKQTKSFNSGIVHIFVVVDHDDDPSQKLQQANENARPQTQTTMKGVGTLQEMIAWTQTPKMMMKTRLSATRMDATTRMPSLQPPNPSLPANSSPSLLARKLKALRQRRNHVRLARSSRPEPRRPRTRPECARAASPRPTVWPLIPTKLRRIQKSKETIQSSVHTLLPFPTICLIAIFRCHYQPSSCPAGCCRGLLGVPIPRLGHREGRADKLCSTRLRMQ